MFSQQVINQAIFVEDDGILCLSFSILFFQDSLLLFECRNLDGKGIVPYLQRY